jgi:hypothetical protein
MGNMADETVFHHRWMRLLSGESVSIVTFEAKTLGWSIKQGFGVSRMGGVTIQTFLLLIRGKVDHQAFKLVNLI